MGPVTMDMEDVVLHDAGEIHTFHFPAGFTHAPLAEVVIHSAAGTDSATDLYWDARTEVWLDDGDLAAFRGPDSEIIDRVAWDSNGEILR